MIKIAKVDLINCIKNADRLLDIIVKMGYNFAPVPLSEIAKALDTAKAQAYHWMKSSEPTQDPSYILENEYIQWLINEMFRYSKNIEEELNNRLFSPMRRYNEIFNDKQGIRFSPEETEEKTQKNRSAILSRYSEEVDKFFSNSIYILARNYDDPKSKEELQQEADRKFRETQMENAQRMVAEEKLKEQRKEEEATEEREKMLKRMKMLKPLPFGPKK